VGLPPPIHLLPSGGAYSSVAQRGFGYAWKIQKRYRCCIAVKSLITSDAFCIMLTRIARKRRCRLPCLRRMINHWSHEARPAWQSGTNGAERFASSNWWERHHMPSPNRKAVKTYLTPDEYGQVAAMADQAGLSISTFVKRVCLGQELRTKTDQQAVLALIKTNADPWRLGGLFKKHLLKAQAERWPLNVGGCWDRSR